MIYSITPENKSIENGTYHDYNRLNNLTSKEWLKFQKSWFIVNPKPRQKNLLFHPAKFPEELVENFCRFFTKEGQPVIAQMVGTGSTIISAMEDEKGSNRKSKKKKEKGLPQGQQAPGRPRRSHAPLARS